MIRRSRRAIAGTVVLVFFLVTIASAVSPLPKSDEKGILLLEEGERLFKDLKYEEAMEKYRTAFEQLRSPQNLARFYLDMSLVYYALGNEDNTKKMIRKIFEFDREKRIDDQQQPKGYVKIFINIRVEFFAENQMPTAVGTPGREKPKKKFPLLLVAGGVVAGGILLYLILSKKSASTPVTETTYTLTVTTGAGVLGSPNSGSYKYKKGTIISYNYSLELDYLFYDLVVKIDGEEVPFQGNITMNSDHSLTAAVVGFFIKR